MPCEDELRPGPPARPPRETGAAYRWMPWHNRMGHGDECHCRLCYLAGKYGDPGGPTAKNPAPRPAVPIEEPDDDEEEDDTPTAPRSLFDGIDP
jgi:hypothetical protein